MGLGIWLIDWRGTLTNGLKIEKPIIKVWFLLKLKMRDTSDNYLTLSLFTISLLISFT